MEISEVFTGRPAGRQGSEEEACYDLLDGAGITYSRVTHSVAATMKDCEEISRALGARICKNLFLCNSGQTEFYLLLMPADKPFKTRLLSPQLGCSRLSFAPAEKMKEMIGCTPGSASVLGLLFDKDNRVKLVADRELKTEKLVGMHPCRNTSSLAVSSNELFGRLFSALGHTPELVNLDVDDI